MVFTGTPIFVGKNVDEDTASVFGAELHSYIITDAIHDEKVLKFKVDYNDVRPQFKELERKQTKRNPAPRQTRFAASDAD